MVRLRLILIFVSIVTSSCSLESTLQAILDNASSESLNTSLSLGVVFPGTRLSLSTGRRENNNNYSSLPTKPSDRFALGSTDKMYTAAAVLRLVESGRIESLDTKALPLMDKLWSRMSNTTLEELLGPQIVNVTVRHLLSMFSGLLDCDSQGARTYQYDHPDEDIDPVASLSFLTQLTGKPGNAFQCAPGSCGEYSSSNYVLLGLILTQAAGLHSWDEYDQMSDLPADVLAEMPSTGFAVHGPFGKYMDVHGFSKQMMRGAGDVFNMSCTNGWTCGNLVSNAADAAYFVRAYLGTESVVSKATRDEIVHFKSLLAGWNPGMHYGLGVMDLRHYADETEYTFAGHGGETFGFNALTGYSAQYDFSISVAANDENTLCVQRVLQQVYAILKSLRAKEIHVLV